MANTWELLSGPLFGTMANAWELLLGPLFGTMANAWELLPGHDTVGASRLL